MPVTAGGDGQRRRRQGRGRAARPHPRGSSSHVFFAQAKLDKNGYPVRDRGSESYLATFEPAATFGNLVKAVGIRRGADHVRQLTILSKGAPWIWNIATAKFPEASQIVDLFHAREHVHDLARRLEFMLGDEERRNGSPPGSNTWTTAKSTASARPPASIPWKATERRDRHRPGLLREQRPPHMRYHWFRQCGLFVGSGLVEAGCKSVIGHRLKRAGMHWTVNGADAIAALRCQQAGKPQDQAWTARRNQMPAAQYSPGP